MEAAKHAVAVVSNRSLYFKGQTVRIESDVVESPDGPSVLVRRWDAATKTVSGFRAYVLVSDLVVAL